MPLKTGTLELWYPESSSSDQGYDDGWQHSGWISASGISDADWTTSEPTSAAPSSDVQPTTTTSDATAAILQSSPARPSHQQGANHPKALKNKISTTGLLAVDVNLTGLMVDFGSLCHVDPLKFASDYPLLPLPGEFEHFELYGISGKRTVTHGVRDLFFAVHDLIIAL